MKGKFREPKQGEIFYRYGTEKVHFVGVAQGDIKVYVFWGWNRYKQRRYYYAFPQWEMEMEWEYLWKTRTRTKLIY